MKCPNCKIDIKTMVNLTTPKKFQYICKCGEDVSKIKLEQLKKGMLESIKKYDKPELWN